MPFAILVLRALMASIPSEIDEAAIIMFMFFQKQLFSERTTVAIQG